MTKKKKSPYNEASPNNRENYRGGTSVHNSDDQPDYMQHKDNSKKNECMHGQAMAVKNAQQPGEVAGP